MALTGNGSSNQSASGTHRTITDEEYQQLVSLASSLKSTPTTEQLGGKTSEAWILDLGASEHMTGRRDHLSDPKKIIESCPVTTPDGTVAHATEMGCVTLRDNLVLYVVLYVPNFTCNLISTAKLTKDLNCAAIFFSSYCTLQDLTLRRSIGLVLDLSIGQGGHDDSAPAAGSPLTISPEYGTWYSY